jgi:hypothetical protein
VHLGYQTQQTSRPLRRWRAGREILEVEPYRGETTGRATEGLMWRSRKRLLSAVLLASGAAGACVPPPTSPLAAVTASCNGYTARLALEKETQPSQSRQPPFVHGVHWRAEIQRPPMDLAVRDVGRPVRVSIETFTVRGQQADRLDIFLGEWRGLSPSVVMEGPVLLSDAFGTFRAGDVGDMFLSVIPPDAPPFGTSKLAFRLRPQSDRVEIAEAAALPLAECPTPGT